MFGKNLEKLIRDRRASKTALAKRLKITRSTLDRYLNEETFMTSDNIEIIAAHFGVTVGSLFGETEKNDVSHDQLILNLQQQINEINKRLNQTSPN